MLRRSLFATAACIVLVSVVAPSGRAAAAESVAVEPPTLLQSIEAAFSDPNSNFRYVANECVLSAAAAMTMTAMVAGSVDAMVGAALGVVPGVSMVGTALIGCAAGAAGGIVSVASARAWEDRAYIQEVAVAQAAHALEAGSVVATAVIATVADPVGTVTTAAAGILAGGRNGFDSVAYAIAGWWQPPSPPRHRQGIELAALSEADEGPLQRGTLF